WWDVRDANYCYCTARDRLSLIDVDSLGAYADEILSTPDVWTKRDKGRATALARLRHMTIRLVLAQGVRGRQKVAATLTSVWQEELEPALLRLGKGVDRKPEAVSALQRFLDKLEPHSIVTSSRARS